MAWSIMYPDTINVYVCANILISCKQTQLLTHMHWLKEIKRPLMNAKRRMKYTEILIFLMKVHRQTTALFKNLFAKLSITSSTQRKYEAVKRIQIMNILH